MNSPRFMSRAPHIVLGAVILFCMITLTIVGHAENSKDGDHTTETPESPASLVDSASVAEINADYETIKHIIEKSCFDCHSRFTNYPWYHSIPGVKQLIESDIKQARRELDFSDGFPFSSRETPVGILETIRHEIETSAMPPWDYRLVHWGTKIEGEKQDSVFSWIDRSIRLLSAQDR